MSGAYDQLIENQRKLAELLKENHDLFARCFVKVLDKAPENRKEWERGYRAVKSCAKVGDLYQTRAELYRRVE